MFNKKISLEDKIDYIYVTLQKQESRNFWSGVVKWIFRIMIIYYLFYMYYYGFESLIEWVLWNLNGDLKINFDNIINQETLDKLKSITNSKW